MNTAVKKAALLLFAAVAFAVVAWNLVPQGTTVTGVPPNPMPSAPAPGVASVVPPSPLPEAAVAEDDGYRDYAIALPELRGLPPDAAAGTPLELWVTWDRPVTRAPKVQRLLSRAFVVRIIPPVTPDGVAAAVLRVPTGRMPDLLYADGYGALSATILN